MKYLPLNSSIFISNRKRFSERMQPNSIAIFLSNDELPKNADQLMPFKQNSELFWLSGIEQEDSIVILFPDYHDKKYRAILVLVRPYELKEKWDGKRLRADEAKQISGMETVVWLEELPTLLQTMIHTADTIYLNTNEHDRKSTAPTVRNYNYRFIDEIKKQYPLHQYARAAKIMHELRPIKSAEEVAVMQQAVNITQKAFERICKFVRPNVMEYEIEAELVHEFLRNRATGAAYSSIIASGERATTLHYITNNNVCKDGELLLMDFGAEYGNYCADMTRTIPVNGRFTTRQKEVYNSCLHLHKYAKSLLRPGIIINDYTQLLADAASKEFIKLGLLTPSDVKNEDPENRAYRKYLYHGISHHLGIDVHDLGNFHTPTKAGMVFTIEPGIYIAQEQMGIRIENNVWLTENGNIDLMKNIPITVEEIEAAMKK